MFPFFKVKEAGKKISAASMGHVQSIHDAAATLGADCAANGAGGWMYESARVWEAALPMNTSHDELRGHLTKALMMAHNVTDRYDSRGPYVTGTFPSHVVYHHGGELLKRPYKVEYGAAGSDPKVTLGDSKKVHTAYVDSANGESCAILTDYPACWEFTKERYISKAERDKMDPADFAGKHRSFPVATDEDVTAALQSLGQAGTDNYDEATIKSNILSIAKRKGLKIPAADSKENVIITLPAESEVVCEGVQMFGGTFETGIQEAGALNLNKLPVKLIGPGWGQMAHYSESMIKTSGPKAFKKGTHMYWNHPTVTGEAERPERDLNDLAAVLTKDAYWDPNGPKGAGLYSEAKVFTDYAQQVAEKGPHIGLSIMAGIRGHIGEADGRTGKIADEFTVGLSTDFVTKAGAKGAVVVAESAGGVIPQIQQQESIMDDKAVEALRTENAELKKQNESLQAQHNLILAVATVGSVLREAEIPYKQSLLERVCANPVMTREGKPDAEWVKSVVADFTVGESGAVRGLGRTPAPTTQPADEGEKRLRESLKGLGIPEAGLDFAVRGGL